MSNANWALVGPKGERILTFKERPAVQPEAEGFAIVRIMDWEEGIELVGAGTLAERIEAMLPEPGPLEDWAERAQSPTRPGPSYVYAMPSKEARAEAIRFMDHGERRSMLQDAIIARFRGKGDQGVCAAVEFLLETAP